MIEKNELIIEKPFLEKPIQQQLSMCCRRPKKLPGKPHRLAPIMADIQPFRRKQIDVMLA
jgi:hypothetical protein